MAKHNDDTDTSVEALLRTKIEDVKEPTQLPSGEWELRCGGASYKSNENFDADLPPDSFSNPRGSVYFSFVPVKPVANVEPDAVADGAWRGRRLGKYIGIAGNDELYEIGKIVGALGIGLEGRDYIDALTLCKNRTVKASVGLRTFKRRTGEVAKENTLSDFAPMG